jgi:arylsulfatase A-like enzyme
MMVDDYVGQLVAQVKASGIESNTLIVFTSDNGCSPAAKINEMLVKGHNPGKIYRGHKADIFEAGHRVPFIVKWPNQIKAGSVSDATICTTDFMATAAAISGYSLSDNEAEDSYSMMPLFNQPEKENFREATVHHSINGSFAIRKGAYKLIMCKGSGGWSYPKPGKDKEVLAKLPEMQLYNLEADPSELHNLVKQNPEKVEELKALLNKYIVEGRSTPGAKQANDTGVWWKHLWWMEKPQAE